jgi:hypothetical protein
MAGRGAAARGGAHEARHLVHNLLAIRFPSGGQRLNLPLKGIQTVPDHHVILGGTAGGTDIPRQVLLLKFDSIQFFMEPLHILAHPFHVRLLLGHGVLIHHRHTPARQQQPNPHHAYY